MAPDLHQRRPGLSVPDAVRQAAARAGRSRALPDPALLRRVRDALARLPDSALHPHYFEIPGDCLASPAPARTRDEAAPAAREVAPR